jgi:hypothetical protein
MTQSLCVQTFSLIAFSLLFELFENFRQKVLETQGDVAVAVIVVLFKDIGHALQRDTALNEQIEAHDTLVSLVVSVEEQLDKLGA